MTASFKPTTKIEAACEVPPSGRYALENVCVSPVGGDEVWLAASNGRILACVKEDGHVEKPVGVPGVVFKNKTRKRGHRDQSTITLDGDHWIDRQHTIHRADTNVGKFPNCESIPPFMDPPDTSKGVMLPMDIASGRGVTILTINTKLLYNLAQAINVNDGTEESDRVSLIMRAPSELGRPVSDSIAVNGNRGFGVIMPVCGDGDRSGTILGQYTDKAKAFKDEFRPFLEVI